MTVHYRNTSSDLRAEKVHPAQQRTVFFKSSVYRNFGKRILDVTLCILGAPFALMLIGIVALLVARDGGSPFYSQLRIGRGGRSYRMWKLRTMVIGADDQLEAYLASDADARAEWDKDQKLKSDPRITPLGSFLRRSSIDELPQIWNVIKGDMSLVGPRPMMPEQQTFYPGRDYYDLRPGITGSWQVSDRNQTSFAERAIFDGSYNRNLTLNEDVRILASTIRVILRATGY